VWSDTDDVNIATLLTALSLAYVMLLYIHMQWSVHSNYRRQFILTVGTYSQQFTFLQTQTNITSWTVHITEFHRDFFVVMFPFARALLTYMLRSV
jgi:hypothetical protein